jgi:hypothetical protein
VNRKLAGGFGAALILTGILGLLAVPSPMSAAVPYDVFHIAFGVVGLACAAAGGRAGRAFNGGFGLIDLYQAAAQRAGWFPIAYFHWRPADLVMHVLVGAALVAAAVIFPA